ncbi:MAG: prepilin-type N-terminal cleavage/methylation domain-containing protein [Chloroflexota bacterium]
MTGGSVPRLRSQRGFSLVELLVAMGIAAFVPIGIGGVVYLLFIAPSIGNARLDAEHDLQNAATWIARDGNMASAFTTRPTPYYGDFTWTDWSGASPTYYTSTYSYSGQALQRTLDSGTVSPATTILARHIAQQGDIVFSSGLGVVTATITSTTSSAQGPVVLTTTVTAKLRPTLAESVPTPVPPGTWPPGNCTQLVPVTSPLNPKLGFYFVITTDSFGTISATWNIAAKSKIEIWIYLGTPFGLGSGTSSTKPGDVLALVIADDWVNGITLTVTSDPMPAGAYTIYFWNDENKSNVETVSAPVTYMNSSCP